MSYNEETMRRYYRNVDKRLIEYPHSLWLGSHFVTHNLEVDTIFSAFDIEDEDASIVIMTARGPVDMLFSFKYQSDCERFEHECAELLGMEQLEWPYA